MNIVAICLALLGLLVFAGGFYVSLCRDREKQVAGYPEDPSNRLHKAVRAHANAIEYAPFIAVLIYVTAQMSTATWVPWVMVVLVLARYLHFAGMVLSPTIAEPYPLRFVGALSTYIFGTLLSLYLVFVVLTQA
ncbi:hypothetical protein AWR36_004820 [Microbulbifer flavimaris]|uniref:MAPEG family protein n=1 Tax=Microbulbifer flavimaris TaxID=1781068 RepID=A0ABX4I3R6_9GAMM|nr:hypothetical protein AWR36_004820 [Microbulbifer flavimaris]